MVQSTGHAAKVLQEVPAKGSPLFPAQNSISKAYWALGRIRPLSHAAVLSVSGRKQRSRDPWGRAILLGSFFFQIIPIKVLSSTLPSFGASFPSSSVPPWSTCLFLFIKGAWICQEWTYPMEAAEHTLRDSCVKQDALTHAERATGF